MRGFYKAIALIVITLFISGGERKEKKYRVVVEGEALKARYAESTKTVTVLTSEDLKGLPFDSLSQLLSSLSFLTVLRRGPESFDVGIRGSSPKRVLILINGLRLNDPQTEHFNMEIPLSLRDIERIEIIKGGTSTFYGSGAFAGAINIVVKGKRRGHINLTGGEKGFFSADFMGGMGAFSLSFSSRRSDGYYPGREFDIKTINMGFSEGGISVFGGLSWKKLGEKGFYAPFPSYEEVGSFLLTGKYNHGGLEFSFLSRGLNDHFILDRTRPEWYENFHNNYLNTVRTSYSFPFKGFSVLMGGEASLESIRSQRLGDHDRGGGAVFLLARKATLKTLFESGLRMEVFSGYSPFAGIYAGMEREIGNGIFFTLSAGNSLRRPTFTELYYRSPANLGNPKLVPEKSLNLETGLRAGVKGLSMGVSVYIRREKGVIDWVRNSSDEPWRAENLPDMTFGGAEFNLKWRGKGIFLGIGGMFNLVFHSIDRETKYALAFEREKISGMVGVNSGVFSLSSVLSYKRMYSGEGGVFLDSRFSVRFRKLTFYIQGNNLFNTIIEEIPGIRIPGRWISGGVSLEL